MSKQKKEYTIEDELRAAMEEPEETVEEVVEEVTEEDVTDEVTEEEVTEDVAEEVEKVAEEEPKAVEEVEPAPVAWSGAVKEKWKDLPAEVRSEIKKREDDVHRMMTAHDGELRLGRSVKEIAAPYEAIIRSEGSTVENAFKDLLNTAYILRTAPPEQKAQLLLETAQQYGVDLFSYIQNNHGNYNPLASLQQEIHNLKQAADPNKIKSQLQEEIERDRITAEINAFAAKPENVHFEKVKTAMGSLMGSGRAANLQEAYDMACWADPSIRAELLNAQEAEKQQKRKAEMAAKKKASASVTGSPGSASPSANAPKKSIEDELRESMRAAAGDAL